MGGRRSTDPEPSHGTRARYQRGCRCGDCKASNALYWSTWRKQRLSGRAPLRSLVSAVEAQRLIRLILLDWESKMAAARALGLGANLARLTRADMIQLRTELRVRRLYRTRVLAPRPASGPDTPVHSS